jgi:glycosyltransferase involved in cell wall biosynthesis
VLRAFYSQLTLRELFYRLADFSNILLELDRQLAWLFHEIQGVEQQCEIFISDNCSTDGTPEIIQKWQAVFTNTSFTTNRNLENIFGVPNLALCLQAAKGKFVWTIGDDDRIKLGTLSHVLNLLKQNPDLAMLYLNFNGYDERTCESVNVNDIPDDHWLDASFAATCKNGQAVFEHCIEQNFGAVIFLTATIYRTQFVQEALRRWPESKDNWGGQGFWTGFCATQGQVMITPDNYVECKLGVSHWQQEGLNWSKIGHRDIPEVFLKLEARAGYSRQFCKKMVLKNYKDIQSKVTHITTHVKTFLKWPRVAVSLVFLLLF